MPILHYFSGEDGLRRTLFDAIDPSSSPPLAKLFLPLFKSHMASEMHLFSIKMKEIFKKLKMRVSGRVRVGVWRALLSQ